MAIFIKETGRSCASLHPRQTDRPDHHFLNTLRKSSDSLKRGPDEIAIGSDDELKFVREHGEVKS